MGPDCTFLVNHQLQAWDTNDLTEETTRTITLSGAPSDQESLMLFGLRTCSTHDTGCEDCRLFRYEYWTIMSTESEVAP